MLIRSQNKALLVNLDNVASICANNGNIIVDYVNRDHDSIAKYSTEEKALKVLDMIEAAVTRIWDCENKFVSVKGTDSLIFEMPPESEV